LLGLSQGLRSAQLVRKGTLFHLVTDDAVAMVWVQRSRGSAGADAYHFAINLGSYSEVALSEDWRPHMPLKPDFGLAQIRWRLGGDTAGGDKWWLVEREEQLEPCVAEVQSLLEGDLPKLLSISTAAGM